MILAGVSNLCLSAGLCGKEIWPADRRRFTQNKAADKYNKKCCRNSTAGNLKSVEMILLECFKKCKITAKYSQM